MLRRTQCTGSGSRSSTVTGHHQPPARQDLKKQGGSARTASKAYRLRRLPDRGQAAEAPLDDGPSALSRARLPQSPLREAVESQSSLSLGVAPGAAPVHVRTRHARPPSVGARREGDPRRAARWPASGQPGLLQVDEEELARVSDHSLRAAASHPVPAAGPARRRRQETLQSMTQGAPRVPLRRPATAPSRTAGASSAGTRGGRRRSSTLPSSSRTPFSPAEHVADGGQATSA